MHMEQALAYVCCSYDAGRTRIQKYCRKIYEMGYIPVSTNLCFRPFLTDNNAEDQQAFIEMSHLLLKRCRMIVVCGAEMTQTMTAEVSMADRLHIICTTLDGLIRIKETE